MIAQETLSNQYLEFEAFGHLLKNPAPVADGVFLAILDVHQLPSDEGHQYSLILPPFIQSDSLIKESRFFAPDGRELDAKCEAFARGSRILIWTKDPINAIRWEIGDQKYPLRVSASGLDFFDGRNSALCYSNGDQPKTIAQWVKFHEEEQNLEALCIIRARNWKEDEKGFREALEAELEDSYVDILLISTDAPLGGDAAPMRSIWEAPDAPGKDRMEEPEHNFWLSSLGCPQILEICRWRFLNTARAVLQVQPSDLVVRRTKDNIFDTCIRSRSGYLQLYGERVFPWRVREDDEISFGDHVVHRFDSTHRNKAWVVVPQGARKGQVWNLFRVGKPLEDNEPKLRFWRFMGLRHEDPEDQNPNLAPRTSLILYPELLEFVKAFFGANPVLPPEPEKVEELTQSNNSGRRCIVTTMKNEGPFLLEWIAYHRAIGFDDFIIYTNDCTDGTDDFLDLLAAKGLVEHYDNPYRESGMKPQHAALFDAQSKPTQQNAEWVICMDVDEYINIKTGDGTLDALFEAVGDANFISLTWRLFGNSGVVDYVDKPIIEQFTQCANEETRFPHQAWGVKTLYRNLGIFKKMGVHRPKGLKPEYLDHIRWVNGSGKPLGEKFIRNGWRTGLASYGYDLVQLNHYAVRSMESFLVKRDRGRVNHVDRDQGLIYWFRMNHNPTEDHSILRMLPKMQAELDRLMADDEIKAQHEACVKAHKKRISELKQQSEYQKFFNEINSERVRKLSRYVPYFGMNVFLIGPDSVPNQIISEIDEGSRQYYNPPSSMVTGDGHS